MAKLQIDIDKNEHELYDVTTVVNGELIFMDDNYTSEAAAESAGRAAFGQWWEKR